MEETPFNKIKTQFENQNIYLTGAKKAVCLPLSPKIDYGFVHPDAWTNFSLCRRQLSWYTASKFAGKYLLVSNIPLSESGIELVPETIIEKIKFKPENLPGKNQEKIQKLYENRRFQERCPSEFLDIDTMDSNMQERWLKVMGIRGISYTGLFKEQCANHANFIQPEYYVENKGGIVPYSIGKTNKICSACLQFFNIIGTEFETKYVVPCPGAALFAGMSVNKYYRVQSGPFRP